MKYENFKWSSMAFTQHTKVAVAKGKAGGESKQMRKVFLAMLESV